MHHSVVFIPGEKMKKSEILYFIAMGTLALGIVLVIIFKFVLNQKPQESFTIKNMDEINVIDLSGNRSKLANFLEKDDITYLLIFQLNDCYSCIYRGMKDLKDLQQAGKQCLGLVVHDYTEEVSGWSTQQDFSPFLVLKRLDFFEYVKSAHTPVFVKIVKGKIDCFWCQANSCPSVDNLSSSWL
jgi:hypothetical protein